MIMINITKLIKGFWKYLIVKVFIFALVFHKTGFDEIF
jgi:hypothetical protein